MRGLAGDYRTWLFTASALRLAMGLCLWYFADSQAGAANVSETLKVLNKWLLSPDALGYHRDANLIVQIWQGVAPASDAIYLTGNDLYTRYPTLLALSYWLAGSHPLAGIALNSLFFMLIGMLAHNLALGLGRSRNAALYLSLAICLWPPSFAYSSTLMKDSCNLLALFMMLAGMTGLLRREAAAWPRVAGWALLLFGGVYLFINVRPVLAILVACFAVGGVVLCAISGIMRGRAAPAWRYALALGVAVCGLFASSHLDLFEITLPDGLPRVSGLTEDKAPIPPARRNAAIAGAAIPADPISSHLESLEHKIWKYRLRYVKSGGMSLLPDAGLVPLETSEKIGAFLRGVRDILLRPFPWNRWPYQEGSRLVRWGIVGWTLLWYLALPGLGCGFFLYLFKGRDPVTLLAIWTLLCGVVMSLIVLNMGTLFRHRDLVLLPLLLVFSPRPYLWLLRPRPAYQT